MFKLIKKTLFFLMLSTTIYANNIAYMSCNSEPWGATSYNSSMNTVFGVNKWDDYRMSSGTAPFTGNYSFVYLEGSDSCAQELQNYLDTNREAVESFVSNGGTLFLDAAENNLYSDDLFVGFGDLHVITNYSRNVVAVDSSNSIWNGPYLPVSITNSGNYFGHADVRSSTLNIKSVITGTSGDSAEGKIVFGTFTYGKGFVLVGGMTAVEYHTPSTNGENINLLLNILSYVGVEVVAQIQTKEILEDVMLTFSSNDFKNSSGNVIPKIKITSLPINGILKVNDINVTIDQEIVSTDYERFTYHPKINYSGNDNFSWQAFINNAYGSTLVQNINITSINDAPTSNNLNITISEDTSKTFSSSDFTFADVDANSSLNSIVITTLPTAGTLKLSATDVTLNQQITTANIANLVFTPAAYTNGIPYTTFGFKVNDGEANSTASYSVTINVTGVNHPPILNTIPNQTTTEDFTDLNITLGATDVDGDPITYTTSSSNTSIATVSIVDGKLVVTPIANVNGVITIEVNATANGQTSTQTFILNINAVDDAPRFTSQIGSYGVSEDAPSYSVMLQASDVENNLFTYHAVASNNNVTISLVDNNLTITPKANANGAVNVDVNVTQENNTSLYSGYSFTITINPVNDAPTIDTPFADINMTEDKGITNYELNVSDIEGDAIHVSVESNNTNILNVTPNFSGWINQATWSNPNKALDFNLSTVADANGIVRITITAQDADKNSTRSFDVNVTAVNDRPVISAISDLNVSENFSDFTINLHATDIENDILTFSAQSNNTSIATVRIDGNALIISSILDAYGVVTIDVNVTDGNLSDVKSFYVNINKLENLTLSLTDVAVDKHISAIYIVDSNGIETMLTENNTDIAYSHYYAIKVILSNETVWWYNYADAKLYQVNDGSPDFIKSITSATNNIVIDASSANWIAPTDTTSPTITKIYDRFRLTNASPFTIAFNIYDSGREGLRLEITSASNSVLAYTSSHTGVINYDIYHATPITLTITPSSNTQGLVPFEVKVTDSSGNTVSKHFMVVIENQTFHEISSKENNETYNAISSGNITNNLYSFNSWNDYNSTTVSHVVEYGKHAIVANVATIDTKIRDVDGVVTHTTKVADIPQTLKFVTALNYSATTSLFSDNNMPFVFTDTSSRSQKVYVKELNETLSADQNYSFNDKTYASMDVFISEVIDNNSSYGLLRSFDKSKILTLDSMGTSGNLIEINEDATISNYNVGTWERKTVNGYETLILHPVSNIYQQDAAFVFDAGTGMVRFANYKAIGDIYSYVLLNKAAKDEVYKFLSPNPKIETALNNGYTYISLPSSKTLCDENVQNVIASCDKKNTLESVFGTNSHVNLVFKFGREWMYWNSDANASPLYSIQKFSTINPLEGIMVKTSAETSVYLPFDEDSEIVNNYFNLFSAGWILMSNNKAQTVGEISASLAAQHKELVYILLLRDNIWHVNAPTNDSAVNASIPRINSVNRYESYWVYFR